MSTDSPQIDITPYKVKRESVITSQQQKTWDPNPNDDLASSILNKLTEIRGNLYPTHLNIPPHKSGAPQSTSPYGQSYLSTSLVPQESRTLSSGIDALLKRDIPDYSAELLKSRDQSPSALSRDSPIFETSYSTPANQPFFYSNTFKNVEIPDKNTENTTIPKIEMNFNSIHSHDLLSHISNPSFNAQITKDYKTQFLTESSPQTNSPDYSPQHNDKSNLYHMSSGYEPHKNSLISTNAHSHMNITESIRTALNPLHEKSISQNELYIPIARNGNLSPESSLTYTASKSNPTSTRATQTKVHISATARLPSVGKPASRVQLINSLNEALRSGHDDTTADSKTLEGTHKRLERSMEAPKKTGVSKGEKMKPKNKSTVMLANIIAQNQDAESQRFSFGHVGSESSGSAQQTGRSNYSQKDREIQAYIDTVSRNQAIRAEALKKRFQNPASSTSFENHHVKSQSTNGRIKAQADKNILVVEESRDREYRSQRQNNKQKSEKQTGNTKNYNQPRKNSEKTQSREQHIPSSQHQPQKKKTLPLNQDAQSSNQSQRDVSARDSSQEEHALGNSQSVINEDSTPQDSERYTDIEDNPAKLPLAKGSYREKGMLQSTARTQPETIRNHDRTTHREAAASQVYSELVKSKPTTKNQLDDELSQVSFLKEPHASKTRSRLTTKSQFENLPNEDSIRSRPLTRSQLDDETRDSGQGAFQRFPGSGSGSSSPARSTTTDIIVAKKLDYMNQNSRGNESPIRLREISAHSERESVVEKSYRSESQERSIEKNKSANVAESPKSSNKRVSEDNMKPVTNATNKNREKRMESVDEREVIVSQTHIDTQDKQSPAKQGFPVSQRSQMSNYSPERPNLGVIMSPQPQNFNVGNNTAQMQRGGYNMQMSPNLNFQMQSPNLENDANSTEYQQQMLMMTNYYQTQINNLKSLVAQQNETINQERYKSQMFERKNMELTRTIQDLERTIKNQSLTLDSTQKELKARYEIVLEELASLKRTMLTYQVTAPQQQNHPAPKTYPSEGKEYQTLLYHEILSLRKDLENQRSTMYDFRSSTRHLEEQMRDLEKMYIDELKSNSKINHKREHLQESLEAYKKDYLKMDTLNQILIDGYERTRKDLGTMGNGQNQEMVQELDIQTARQGRSRNVYIGSPSPTKYEVEATNQEMLRNKMKAEESQMKNILQWSSKNEGTSIHYISNNFTTPRGKIPQGPSSDYNQQSVLQSNQSQNGYALNRGYSPQPNQSSVKRIAITDRKAANKSHVVFPTYQKMEDPREQVRRIDQTIAELGQHKKYVENELFKMPSVPKTLDQKRKKAGLEMELEGVENQIEECKNQLRKYT